MEFNNSKRMELINTMVTELPVLRARIGASQADISEKIGISRQTYNAIENGKKKLNWTVFLALFAVFSSDERTLGFHGSFSGGRCKGNVIAFCNES